MKMKRRGKTAIQKLFMAVLLAFAISSGISASAFAGTGARLNKTSVKVSEGSTVKLKVLGASGKVKWSSSNKKIATVSSKGVVTGRKPGSVNINAIVRGETLTARVTVKAVKWTNYKWASKTYLTGLDEADYLLELICRQVLGKPGKPKVQQMKLLYEYTAKASLHYAANKNNKNNVQAKLVSVKPKASSTKKKMGKYSMFCDRLKKLKMAETDWEYSGGSAMSLYESGRGDCYTTALALQALFGHIGVKSIIMEGTNNGGGHHVWNGVYYNGKLYMCDADGENWDYYMDYSNANGLRTFYRFMCGTNYFNSIGFGFNPKSYPKVQADRLKY